MSVSEKHTKNHIAHCVNTHWGLVEACRLANKELLALGVGSSASPALKMIWEMLALEDDYHASTSEGGC